MNCLMKLTYFLKLKEHNCLERKKKKQQKNKTMQSLPRCKHSVTEQVYAFQHIRQ